MSIVTQDQFSVFNAGTLRRTNAQPSNSMAVAEAVEAVRGGSHFDLGDWREHAADARKLGKRFGELGGQPALETYLRGCKDAGREPDKAEPIMAAKAALDACKRKMPFATPHGCFAFRKNAGLRQFSPFVFADIDHVADAEKARNTLAQWPSCASAWLSASGEGVHALFAVEDRADEREHEAAWRAVRDLVLANAGYAVDEGAKGVARAMFLPCDPDAHLNATPSKFAWRTSEQAGLVLARDHAKRRETNRKANGLVELPNRLGESVTAEGVRRIANAPVGERHNTINKTAFTVAGAGGDIEAVLDAARASMPDATEEAERTVRDAFDAGASKPFTLKPPPLLGAYANEHLSFGREVVRRERGLMLFDKEQKSWWRYEGGRWREDDHHAERVAWSVIEDGTEGDFKASKDWRRAQHMTGSLRAAQAVDGVAVEASRRFDALEPLVGLPGGGVLDLDAGTTRIAEPTDFVARTLGVAPNVNVKPERWLRFLREAFALFGDETDAAIAWLRWWLKDALRGRACRNERLVFLQGKTRTGKSTLAETVAHVFGEHATTLSGSDLLEGANRHRDWLMPLRFARLAITTELSAGAWKAELLNAIVSGEPVVANHMRQRNVRFTPRAHVLIAGNERPRTANSGFMGRVCLLEMQSRPKRIDPELKLKLKAEAAGVLAWIVGAGDHEPPRPNKMIADTSAYAAAADVLATWLDERCELGATFDVPAKPLYEDYKRWCEGANERALGLRKFGQRLDELGLKVEKRRAANVRVGVRVRADAASANGGFETESEDAETMPF